MPGKFIYSDDLTGDTVSILGVNGSPMPYQTAKIPITLNYTTVYDTVAVAPADQLNAKVLLSTPINSVTTQNLLDSYLDRQKQHNQKEVNIATRSSLASKPAIDYYPRQDDGAGEDDRASDLSYEPDSDTDSSVMDRTDSDVMSEKEPMVQAHAPPVKCLKPPFLPSNPDQTHNQTLKLSTEPYSSSRFTEPYSSNTLNPPILNTPTEPYSSRISNPLTEPYSSTPPTEPYSSITLNPFTEPNSSKTLKPLAEPYSPDNIISPTSEVSTHKETNCPGEQPLDIFTLPILEKGDNIEALKSSSKADQTLKIIRGLAHHHKNGYTWDNGLLYHMSLDPTLGERKRLVVPQSQGHSLIEIAHDKSGHFSVAKTRAVFNNRFTWPKMGTDIQNHILSCIKCKQYNKVAHKQVPFHTRPTITEPYQEIALDIIGPLPRTKHGYNLPLQQYVWHHGGLKYTRYVT